MAMNITDHSINFARDQANIALRDKEGGANIHLTFSLPTPGDQTEGQLKAASREAAKKLLQAALDAL